MYIASCRRMISLSGLLVVVVCNVDNCVGCYICMQKTVVIAYNFIINLEENFLFIEENVFALRVV